MEQKEISRKKFIRYSSLLLGTLSLFPSDLFSRTNGNIDFDREKREELFLNELKNFSIIKAQEHSIDANIYYRIPQETFIIPTTPYLVCKIVNNAKEFKLQVIQVHPTEIHNEYAIVSGLDDEFDLILEPKASIHKLFLIDRKLLKSCFLKAKLLKGV
jgi:hypothetical protein